MVGNLTVHDPDTGDGGRVHLSTSPLGKDAVVPFSVSASGKISTLLSFDREDRSEYVFHVVARDQGQSRRLSSTTLVTVKILDINDNPPSFIFPSEQNCSALVNVPVSRDSVVLQVDVYDNDASKNSIITYSIVPGASNASDMFRIGKFSGDVIANRPLSSLETGTYSLTINASDQGSPVLSQARTLHLIVQSKSAKTDDVIADQNVLIVALIVCFTVMVSGAVLVAMCYIRRLDRQRKLQYSTSCCPDGGRAESESGSTIGDGGNQQYDLAVSVAKITRLWTFLRLYLYINGHR